MSKVKDGIQYKTYWLIRKYANDADFARGEAFEEVPIDGNMLLNAGITALLTLGIGGSETAYNNANARIGVGDSSAAESASQTALQAATNKLLKAMSATYPQVAAQSFTFRAAFTGAEANFAWQEFVIDNGAGAAKTLNRKVSNQGTKTSGQTWTLDVVITLS